MLINDPKIGQPDFILSIVAEANGNSAGVSSERTGVYTIGHFGSSHWPQGYEHYPEFDSGQFYCYGVCDNVEQILAACPAIEEDPAREFIITLTPIVRANQPRDGGWRWHKWGDYIGTHTPQHEYLYDEEGIDRVLVYHVYERKLTDGAAFDPPKVRTP